MVKMVTRSSPGKSQDMNGVPQSQNILRNPSTKLCKFTFVPLILPRRETLFHPFGKIVAFWAIDSTIRTSKPKIKESEETTSTSYMLSSAPRSTSKPASKFSLDDIDSMISPRSTKKELAKGQSHLKPKTVTARAKVVTEAHQDKCLAEAKKNLDGLYSIVAAKDKKITQLKKEVKSLEKQIMVAEM
ncbi:hypothetical protein Hanom_Chr16g01444711 [Helianthus anomalus]